MLRTRLGIAVGVCLGVGVAFAGISSYAGGGSASVGGAPVANGAATVASTAATAASSARPAPAPAARAGTAANVRGTYIVVLKEPALAGYKGGIGRLAAPQRIAGHGGKARLDVRSASARDYVRYLGERQVAVETVMARAARGPMHVRTRMQHVLNGMVVDMSTGDADVVRKLPDVAFVEEYREYPLDTDQGPQLIGAPAVWGGTNPGAPAPYQGEGMVTGILDSGINFGSPSFAGISPLDGYSHVNPLGSGTYLGTCAPGGVDEGRCNDKLIGGYDFVCEAPGNTCADSTIREEPGFGDTNSHGSHVASTVAGNRRADTFAGNQVRISGVAPRANIVAFDVCFTSLVTGQGLCPNVSAVAAINQAVADGVVDALNYSVGGGAQPWSDSVSLAFLDAVEAGIYVAASAGNSGPGPNTMGHLEPWVSSTAAVQHGRGAFTPTLQVSGPQPVPEPLTPAVLDAGSNGVAHTTAIPDSTPVKLSPTFSTALDGCAAFPADTFAGAIAVMQRGGCSFTIKANAAQAAGAIAAIMVNNAPGGLIPSAPDTAIRVFGLNQETGAVLQAFTSANANVTGGISFPMIPVPNVVDALAEFSSRGPAGTFDMVKPDVAAPGADILAAVSGETLTGSENALATFSGTSMASPHQAGAALLVRQARPGWTVPEVKSALAMTAEETVLLEDQTTPANAFAAGAGRIRVDRAINAGLVLDETKEDYLAADPAKGGEVSALNQPSMARRSCFGNCQFVRTFRNPTSRTQSFSTRLSGVTGRVIPATVRVAAGASVSVRVVVDSSSLPTDGSWNFGKLTLTPTGSQAQQPVLHLPVAVAVQPAQINLGPVNVTARQGATGRGMALVSNRGGSLLTYNFDLSGTGSQRLVDRAADTTNGYRGTVYSDQADPRAEFAADDFTLSQPTQLSRLAIHYFLPSGVQLATATNAVTWSIYPDANGLPAGNPLTTPGTAVWRHTAAPTAAGVTINGTELSLDLAAAGQQVNLAPGKYWLVVNTQATLNNRLAWYATTQGEGGFATVAVPASGSGTWAINTTFTGLAMQVSGLVPCRTAWINAVNPASGNLRPAATRGHRVDVTASGLQPGSYQGGVCVVSNDPAAPRVVAPIRLTVTR